MIHECQVDRSINLLLGHFQSQLLLRPPASAAEIAELEAAAGHLPRCLTIFLSTCNGLRLPLRGLGAEGCFWGTHEMLDALTRDGSGELVPVRGQRDAERDWVVVRGPQPAIDAVVRWDPTTRGAVLVGSNFDRYFAAFARYAVEHFTADGKRRSRGPLPTFDVDYVARFDPQLTPLAALPEVHAWLRELDVAVATGDDFE